jgi:type VI secretion system protein VasG
VVNCGPSRQPHWSEYKKYFEKDAALARRFQVVKVEEPTEEQCMVMLRGTVSSLETHHALRILEESVSAAVKLSHRYLAGRQLPDKAVSVLDTACARLALGQNATPPAIEDKIRRLDDLVVQKRILERESAVGANHGERLQQIASETAAHESSLNILRERWDKERELVRQIRDLRSQLEESARGKDGTAIPIDVEKIRAELTSSEAELAALQGEHPLMRVCVDEQIVGEVISGWTGQD